MPFLNTPVAATQCASIPLCYVCRLQDRLEAVDEETELMEDWREKYGILKSGMDAADEKVTEGEKAKSHEEIENCYIMLKVRFFFQTSVFLTWSVS